MTNEKRTLGSFGIQIFMQSCIVEKPKPVTETRDIAEIPKRVLEHIKTHCSFSRRSIPGLIESNRENAGVLRCRFKLSAILKKCGLAGAFDNLVFMAIDNLIQSGKLVFLQAGIKQFMNFRDIGFICEFAQCTKSNYPREEYNILRFYPAEPLSKKERDKRSVCIVNITEHVARIRARRDKYFKQRFGSRGNEVEIEREIDRENAEIRREEHRARTALLDLGKRVEVPEQSETKV